MRSYRYGRTHLQKTMTTKVPDCCRSGDHGALFYQKISKLPRLGGTIGNCICRIILLQNTIFNHLVDCL